MKRFAFIAATVVLLIALTPLLHSRGANAATDAVSALAQPVLPGIAKPLVSGEFVSGTIWEKPLGATGSNTGYSPAAGSRVDVYDQFIIITDTSGVSEISLNGSYTRLRFKPYHP